MDRRSFLKLGGLAATAGLTGSCGQVTQKIIPYVTPPDDGVNPVAGHWYATTCLECNAGCGIHVRTVNGRAKKIEGNPSHPISGGKVCARGQAAIQRVYHPERLTTPLARNASGGFDEIAWDKAVALLSEKLKSSKGKVLYLNDGINNHTAGVASAIFKENDNFTIASNNNIGTESHHRAASLFSEYPRTSYPDMENADFTILFGADIFESDRNPIFFARAFGESRRGRPSKRGRMVYLGSRMSSTAASCDKWIPTLPGQLGVVALSIAHVIVEEVINRELAQTLPRNSVGRWSAALKEYTPERVTKFVDVKADVIRKLAKPFVDEAPAVAIAGDDVVGYTNGVDGLTAIEFINMISYEIGREKLRIKPRQMPETDPDMKERMLEWFGQAPNKQSYSQLSETVDGMKGGKFSVAIISHTNPVYDTPEKLKFTEALAAVPFKAVFANFKDETASEADLILPDHHWLESWGAEMPDFVAGIPIVNLLQPVIRPFHDKTRAEADILIEASEAAGLNKPADSGEAYIQSVIAEFRAEMFQIAPILDDTQAWQFLLQNGGSWPEVVDTEMEPEPESGLLWDLKEKLTVKEASFDGSKTDYPFHLHLYQTVHMGRGEGANQGWLQETPDPITSIMWQFWIELSEQTAEKMGIIEGDLITVTSPHGKITGPAFPYVGIRPDVIAIPVGYGHTNYGKHADGRGANAMLLLGDKQDELSGAHASRSQLVKISKTGGSIKVLRRANHEGEHHGEVFQL